ncbi:DUF5326 family protein [Streptomyces sp. Z26]|uniref:DUF5326 family protein n=1 Tax=Streptomyces TaxID=1883 RepID=UPI000EF150BE|nr:DUF5326 family protein [Streptomyces sp. Z26]RLL67876.1 hypothetical protein D7M15_14660 [Streptomyces sp. Z26]
MAAQDVFATMPWWVKWVAVPLVVLVVFGGLIASVVGFLIALLFKVLVVVAVIGGLMYVVRRFTSASSSSRHDDW